MPALHLTQSYPTVPPSYTRLPSWGRAVSVIPINSRSRHLLPGILDSAEFSVWRTACVEVASVAAAGRGFAASNGHDQELSVKLRCFAKYKEASRRSEQFDSGRSIVMKNVLGLVLVAGGVLGVVQSASAQLFVAETHYDSVPHSTTHIDYIRHGNHVDADSHTTTHRHSLPHRTYRRVYPRRVLVPHASTHVDYLPHGNHVDPVPHTTTHFDAVPTLRREFGRSGHHGHFFQH